MYGKKIKECKSTISHQKEDLCLVFVSQLITGAIGEKLEQRINNVMIMTSLYNTGM